jgi:hypothetical protein
LPVLTALAVAVGIAVRLASVLPEVPNRHAFTYDAARRAMVDVDAADALRTGKPGDFLFYVGGPEAWPTLRLIVAAPAHAAAGPVKALAVEHSVSLVLTALLFLVLGLAALCVGPRPGQALPVFAIAAPVLMGNRDLFEHAVNGMLEVPSALFTLAATAAWLVSRDAKGARPWAVALLGNLLFHVKFQHGLMFAIAVLLTEAIEGGAARALRAVLSALVRGVRDRLGMGVLAVAIALILLALWVVATGGVEGTVLGQALSLRRARGPIAFGALALFAFVELAFWRDRARLGEELPARLSHFWSWLVTPMVAWLLVPFTWRLQTLGASVTFDSQQTKPGAFLEQLLYFPRIAWEGWFPPSARGLVIVLLCATALAAWRSAATRRVLLPFGAVIGVELAVLTLFNHRNYQPRLTVNLAPLLALVAAAWVPALPRWPRAVLASSAAALLLWAVLPLWRSPTLVATLSRGFESTENGDACRSVARALPISRGVLVNQTSPSRLQTCAMWVKFLARERGAEVVVRAPWTRPGPHEVLMLADDAEPFERREGLVPEGPEVQFGSVRGQRYRSAMP